MKAAFLSEFLTARNVLSQSAGIYVVVAAVLGISMQSVVALVAAISAMTPFLMLFTFCAYDSMNGWERFRATLPISRCELVVSRYVNVLLSSVVMFLLGWALACLISGMAPLLPLEEGMRASLSSEFDPGLLAIAGLMGLSLMTAVVALFLPFALRYGLTKAMRVVPVVMVMLIPVSIALLKQFPSGADVLVRIGGWLDANLVAGGVAFAAAALVVYAASCCVAVSVYRRKEL